MNTTLPYDGNLSLGRHQEQSALPSNASWFAVTSRQLNLTHRIMTLDAKDNMSLWKSSRLLVDVESSRLLVDQTLPLVDQFLYPHIYPWRHKNTSADGIQWLFIKQYEMCSRRGTRCLRGRRTGRQSWTWSRVTLRRWSLSWVSLRGELTGLSAA